MILDKPEYFFRPKYLFSRILSKIVRKSERKQIEVIKSLLGFSIKLGTGDVVGRSMLQYGLYDLVVTEAILRLSEDGTICMDGGANYGYTAMIMSKINKKGKIFCFEANPAVAEVLEDNLHKLNNVMNAVVVNKAISDGKNTLNFLIDTHNIGASRVVGEGEVHDIAVQSMRIDEMTELDGPVSLFKIDIEGHELNALKGCCTLLERRQIKNVLYEDHNAYPSAVSDLLESYGFSVFKLDKGFWGPKLVAPTTPHKVSYEPPNYLATTNTFDVKKKMHAKGWLAYKIS